MHCTFGFKVELKLMRKIYEVTGNSAKRVPENCIRLPMTGPVKDDIIEPTAENLVHTRTDKPINPPRDTHDHPSHNDQKAGHAG